VTTLRIPGREDAAASHADRAGWRTSVVSVRDVRTFRIDAARRGAASAVADATDKLVEIELDDGVRLWTLVERLPEYFPPEATRGAGDGVLDVPPRLDVETPARGLHGSVALKALRLLDIDIPGRATRQIAERIDAKLERGEGLFRCRTDRFGLEPVPDGGIPTDQPVLILVHGTFSSCRGSFADLWDAPAGTGGRLVDAYEGRVFGFDHRTLTRTPIENALLLAEALPPAARVHLLSHSRGGLIGELLCRAQIEGTAEPFDSKDAAVLEGAGLGADAKHLLALGRRLRDRRIHVARFIRVGCPSRGTTLASGRIERWLSILVNLIGAVPGLKGNLAYDLLTELTVAIARQGFDPATAPGLAAMSPDAPLVQVLNRPGIRVRADLHVVAGDTEASGVLGRLKLLLPDLFYGGDNDLVVNTASMYGGADRVDGVRHALHQGASVHHLTYFRNASIVRQVRSALAAEGVDDDGFELLPARDLAPIPRMVRRGATGPQPVVFVLPGITGSHLRIGNNRIWLDPLSLAFGGMKKLRIDAAGVVADSVIGLAYGDLVDFLAGTHTVITFPYDWRRSVVEEARRLGDAVSAALDELAGAQPVRIVAHSMGGLVARTMIGERPDVWGRIRAHEGGRLIMLGTPTGGSHSIVQLLTGRERMIRQLAALDWQSDVRELLAVIAAFPGVLELLPRPADRDFYATEIWQELRAADDVGAAWAVPDPGRLAAVRAWRDTLEQTPVDPERTLYIAGAAPSTVIDVEIRPDGNADRLTFIGTALGDGRVPWATGIPLGVRTWYANVAHGDLADHEPAFAAILDLLQRGDTQRLPTSPAVARGARERFELPPEPAVLYPDAHDLARTALGGRRRVTRRAPRRKLRVGVVHGNLSASRHAVAVGHYAGDLIVSAEDYLDRQLGGRLRERHALGLYPGQLGSVEVVLNPGAKPGGAVVVGLGDVGELTPGGLTASFARAVVQYAVALAEQADPRARAGEGPLRATLATLLIGTAASGLSVADSVTALLRGALGANRLLDEAGYADRVRLDALEIVELYEDRAIQAVRALGRALLDPELLAGLEIDPLLRPLRGGRRRVAYEEDPRWWRRLAILQGKDGGLVFNTLTDKARAEVNLLPTQRALIDRFVDEATGRPASDPEVAETLFELLLPNELKAYAPDRRNLVLVLDEHSARYPWELLQDRRARDLRANGRPAAEPLAVQMGIVRQLATQTYRRREVVAGASRAALVIGDPPSRFPALPGAAAEAARVEQILSAQGYTVTSIVAAGDDRAPRASEILHALFAADYRIVHLAGHGAYEYPQPEGGEAAGDRSRRRTVTGMVIGDDAFLTPDEIEQMRTLPEIVFVNCCTLGRIERRDDEPALWASRHRLAANLAWRLIDMGVRAVIAAGWEVDDAAATAFADRFYRAMFAGETFGDAVRLARAAAHEFRPHANTWGAYQCYGDPAFTLMRAAPAVRASTPGFVALAEAVAELDNIAADATTADGPEAERLLARVCAIEEEARGRGWLERADVRCALARAYGDLAEFEPAIGHYEKALEVEQAEVPLSALEQLSSLQARLAPTLPPAGRARARALLAGATARLAVLQGLADTVERRSLQGAVWKRRAMLAGPRRERETALAEMAKAYAAAYDLSRERRGEGDPYALLNWRMAEVLAGLGGGAAGRGRRRAGARAQAEGNSGWDDVRQAEALAARRDDENPSFWDAVIPAHFAILRHLHARDLGAHVDAIAAVYERAVRRGASRRELGSERDHLDFLLRMVQAIPDPATRDRLAGALEAFRERVFPRPGRGYVAESRAHASPMTARAARRRAP
jgi:CHAT domain/Lecithin:cholesterol acyltransferase